MQEDLVNPDAPTDGGMVERTAELHRAFDERFRAPVREASEATLDVLTVVVGDELVAIPVDDLVHLASNPKLVRIPDAPAHCIGIAGHRGRLVAVFDLGLCLGRTTHDETKLVLISRRDPAIGFGVRAIDRYRRVARSSIVPPSDRDERLAQGTLVDDVHAVVVSVDELVRRIDVTTKEAS